MKTGNVLLIVPPFHGLDRPSLAAHLLQAVAKSAGFRVHVLYANALLAKRIGEASYEQLCYSFKGRFLWERLFSQQIFNIEPEIKAFSPELDAETLQFEVKAWLDEIVSIVVEMNHPIVGCTAGFSALASITLLSRIKLVRPRTITIIGGPSCEGEMAEGIRAISKQVDYIFSGDSEKTFTDFLHRHKEGRLPDDHVIYGSACMELDDLPCPDYKEFYDQFSDYFLSGELKKVNRTTIPYETSRGCWWGEKYHCTFCGVNGEEIRYRKKDPDKVLRDLRRLASNPLTNRISMTDNVMPHEYYATLLPDLAKAKLGLEIFYEQKANLTLEQLIVLKNAGINFIQAGIESLSDTLLKRMNKGVTTRQNIALLRFAIAAEINVTWNILAGFPGDTAADYAEMLIILPLIHHLMPPQDLYPVSIARSSPYYISPLQYGIRNIQTHPSYDGIYPDGFPVEKIAYHFIAQYDSIFNNASEVCERLRTEITLWQRSWEIDKPHPVLTVAEIKDGQYLLIDTRGLPGLPKVQFIDKDRAAVALTEKVCSVEAIKWGVANRVCIQLKDHKYIPLATASPRLISELRRQSDEKQ